MTELLQKLGVILGFVIGPMYMNGLFTGGHSLGERVVLMVYGVLAALLIFSSFILEEE